jgi:hypothetical protein
VTLPNSCPPGQQQCDELYSAACVTYTGNTVSCTPLLLTPLMTAGDSVQTALYNIANLLCTVANGGGGSGGSGVDPAVITALQTCCTTNTTAITSINTQLTTINNTISSIQGAVTILNTNVSTIQGDITTIQGDITTINIDIANLQSCCSNSGSVSGNLNRIAKFTPNGTTVGNSQMVDDGDIISVNGSVPSSKFTVNADKFLNYAGYFNNPNPVTSNIGIYAESAGGIAANHGLQASAFGGLTSYGAKLSSFTSVNSYGVYTTSSGTALTIGGFFEALGAATKYSVQLRDGTEGTAGWYLRNMTTDGMANWAKINITEVTNGLSSALLGAPNGIATLDSTSKLTIAQMPITVMDYKGTYDIVTNTPVLVDGTGNQGDVYVNTAAGTRTFGAGNTITVGVGDWLIYNGTKWEKTLGNNVGAGTVTSVGLTTGTTGTDVNVSNSPITTTGAIALNIPTIGVAGVTRGVLSSSDWTLFNNKVSTTRTISTTAPLQGGGDLSANRTLSITQATSSVDGYLSASEWTLFNNKIGGSGTLNYGAKFTAGNTIAASRLYEDTNSFSIGIGASAFASTIFYAQGVAGQTTGGSFQNHTGGTSNGYGLIGTSNQTAGNNIGVAARALGTGAATNIGMKAEAVGAANNYSIQLVDGTQTTVGRYLRNMTTDGKANWANIQVSEVTGAIGSTGTLNYIAKFTPDGTMVGNSQIRDDATSVGINIAPNANSKLSVLSTAQVNAIFGQTNINNGTAVYGQAFTGTGTLTGVLGFANSTTSTINIGVNGRAQGASVGTNIGVKAEADGASNNYAIQLKDGSETVLGGRYLRDMGDGKGRWSTIPMLDSSQIMCSDMFTVITANATTNASTIKAYWAAPCNGTFTDMFASLFTAQVGGSAFTVVIRASGGLVGTLTFANGQNTSPIITSTSSFTKGNIYEFYVTQAGDGSARGLLVTLNYQRT